MAALTITGLGSVQKSPSSKAAAVFSGGAYAEYVSTEKWRERRWRLFSTDPLLLTIVIRIDELIILQQAIQIIVIVRT
jgi:hypothetical protein